MKKIRKPEYLVIAACIVIVIILVIVAGTVDFGTTAAQQPEKPPDVTNNNQPPPQVTNTHTPPQADILAAIQSQEELSAQLTKAETIEDKVYIFNLSNHATGLADALDRLGETLDRYNSSLIIVNGVITANNEWTNELAGRIQGVYHYTNEAQFIEPPAEYAGMHEVYLQGIEKYRQAMKQLIQAVNVNDAAAIEEFNSLMLEGAELINEAAGMLGSESVI